MMDLNFHAAEGENISCQYLFFTFIYFMVSGLLLHQQAVYYYLTLVLVLVSFVFNYHHLIFFIMLAPILKMQFAVPSVV